MHSIQPDSLVSSSRRRLDRPARRGGRRALSARLAKNATRTRARAYLGIGALAALVVACDADVGGPDEVEATISVARGDNQRGNVNFRLSGPLVVRVMSSHGLALEDVEVTWSVISGGGLLSWSGDAPPASVLRSFTGASGLSGVLLTPTVPGITRVAAAAAGLQSSPVTFTAEAIPPDWPPVSTSSLVYDRTSYNPRDGGGCFDQCRGLGSYYERYVLHEDGTFGLQLSSSSFGFSELDGTYGRQGRLIAFHFNLNSAWQATGTVSDDCLVVEYNSTISLDEIFENGEFCRPSETR